MRGKWSEWWGESLLGMALIFLTNAMWRPVVETALSRGSAIKGSRDVRWLPQENTR